MKRLLSFFLLCMVSYAMNAQEVTYSSFPHYNEKVVIFQNLPPIISTDIVMLGNSLTENGGDWNKILRWKNIRNRGIAGDDATGIYHRLNQILPGKPKAIFLMVGINDLSHDLTARQVFDQCKMVIDKIRQDAPETKLFVQSLLPINESFGRWKTLEGKTDVIPVINSLLRKYCAQNKVTYIDLFDKFIRRGTNEMRISLTVDGLHLTHIGYKIWNFELRRYLLSLDSKQK